MPLGSIFSSTSSRASSEARESSSSSSSLRRNSASSSNSAAPTGRIPSSGPSSSSSSVSGGGVRRKFFERGITGGRQPDSGGTTFVRRMSSRSFFRRDSTLKESDRENALGKSSNAMKSTDTLPERSDAEGGNKASSKSSTNVIKAWASRRRTKSSSPALNADQEEGEVNDQGSLISGYGDEGFRQSMDSQGSSSRANAIGLCRKRGQSFVSLASSQTEGSARNGDAFPKKLSGWIMNAMNREETPARERASSASPTADPSSDATGSNFTPRQGGTVSAPLTPENKSRTGGILSSLGSSARPFRFFLESTTDLLKGSDNSDGCWLLGVWHGKEQDEDDMPSLGEKETPSIVLSTATPQGNKVSRIHTGAGSRAEQTPSPSVSRSSIEGSEGMSMARPPSSATTALSGRSSSAEASWQDDFQADFNSRIWCTYRSQFSAIARDGSISNEAASTAEQLSLIASTEYPGESSALAGSSTPPSPHASANNSRLRASASAVAALGSAVSSAASVPPAVSTAAGGLGERMGIPGLWTRATAVAQAAGLAGRAGLTTDAGWGCMLRTGQSLLANALMHTTFGRHWKRPQFLRPEHLEDEEFRQSYANYVRILTWFMDDPSPACPFSVHRMAREGKRLGKEVGEWFGPSTAAGAIKKLVEECPEVKLGVVVATDGEIYLNHIRAASRGLARKDNWETPVLILIGVRLGLSGVNPAYYESIKVSYHDQNLLC